MTSTPTPQTRYTDQQHAAISTRDVSVSLSAGAGCGKTFVLTERYLSHLDPQDRQALRPAQIGQLVAITFTERAAREMRDRIRRRCHERLQAAPQQEAGYWADLLRALDDARISTIHAFCAALLRSHAVESRLDPQFAVLEQSQAESLLSEAIDDEVRQLVSDRDETTLELAVQFGLDTLRTMLRVLVLEATPALLEKWRAVTPDELTEVWEAFAAEVRTQIVADIAASPAARAILSLLQEHTPTNARMRERRLILLDELGSPPSQHRSAAALGEWLERIQGAARVAGGGNAAAWPSPEIYGEFRDQAEALRKLVDGVAHVAGFDPRESRAAALLGTQLLGLADGVFRRYHARKEELRVLDFTDLLVKAHALLTHPQQAPLVKRLSEGITLLLVDEFQDTDPLQVELVRALCGGDLAAGKLFFVGDFKQSIYRFRGAKPHVFRDLRNQTPQQGQQSLSRNFRSQPEILKFVNALFRDDLGDNYEPLVADRRQITPTPAIEFLWAPADNVQESVDQIRAREADWIARRLRELLDSGEPLVWDAASPRSAPRLRPPRPGDVAILLRALTSVESYESALRRYNLDYYLVGGRAFYAQQEVFDVLNLLRAINTPADEVSLVGALRSPFFSIADESLYWLSQHSGGLVQALFSRDFSQHISGPQRYQLEFAAATITELRAAKDRVRISELLERALDITGYDAILLHEFLGERKLANLDKLQEQARSFERGDFLGLADFIDRLAEFVARQPDEALAATHSEDTDVIRLMSVHQSKGLEFPIVVVPDLNRPPHHGANHAHLDERLGPLARPKQRDDEQRVACGYDLWRYAEKVEEAAESNRLLYVATTRAADYLLLSSGVSNLGDARSPWMKLLESRFDLLSGRFQRQADPADLPAEIRVTTQAPSRFKRQAGKPRTDIAALTNRMQAVAESHRPLPAVDPIVADPAARREYSFSRLSGKLHQKFQRLDEQMAASVTGPDPRQLGTLVHAVLGAIDFREPGNLRKLVARMAEQHLPDSPEAVDEAAALVESFLRSPRCQQLASARQSHAEIEFLLAWQPGQGPASHDRADVVLRGYLDRLYQDADGHWHVLDFKTNQVPAAGPAKVAAAYEMQMYVYALAVERILKASPASLTLFFLRSGAEHSFAWNDSARERVVQMVTQGIRAASEPSSASAG